MSLIEIPLHGVGFIYRLPHSNIPMGSMRSSSYNIDFFRGGKGKRLGTTINVSGYSGTNYYITGICQYVDSSGNIYLLVATSDGKIYKDTTNTIATGLAVDTLVHFCVRGNTVYASNGYDTPLKWGGSGNMTALTNIPTDWAGNNNPKYIVAHAAGAGMGTVGALTGSSRLYAFGCSSNAQEVYVSTAYDAGTPSTEDDFSDANVHLLYINTQDSYGIVAAHEWGNRLMFFGRDETFILDDSNVDITYWGTYKAQWQGGTISQRSVCRDPQGDLYVMSNDGHLYRMSTSEKYGDYITASLSHPYYLQEFFRAYYKLNDTLHMQWNHKDASVVMFFETLTGNLYRGIKFHILEQAWSAPFSNDKYDCGYKATASCVARDGLTTYILTGDLKGQTWWLERVRSVEDEDEGYDCNLAFSEFKLSPLFTKAELKKILVLADSSDGNNFDYTLSIDNRETVQVKLASGTGYAPLGSFTLGVSTLGGGGLTHLHRKIGGRGKVMKLGMVNTESEGTMRLVQIVIETKDLRAV